MLFKTSYDTTACLGYKLDRTLIAIKAAYLDGGLNNIDPYNIYRLVGGTSITNDVPAFAHPLSIDLDGHGDVVVIDARSYGRIDKISNEFKITNEIDYALLVVRAKLNSLWIEGKIDWVRNVSPLPMAAFASWISENVGKRFALDPKEQFNLAILSAIFYNSLFTDNAELTEQDKLKLINSVSRSLHASAQDVIEMVDKISIINNVFEFCANAQEYTGSIRLKDFNPGILFALLGGTWFGSNAKEMVAIALEHPPTWMAILLSAVDERTFKNSQISKMCERTTFKRLGEDYVKATVNLLSTAKK